jgi:hypothetical protein
MLAPTCPAPRRRSLLRRAGSGRNTLTGTQVTGLRIRAKRTGYHVRDHTFPKGCRCLGMLSAHGNVLCQSRQNHLDRQHTPDTKTGATNPCSDQSHNKRPCRGTIECSSPFLAMLQVSQRSVLLILYRPILEILRRNVAIGFDL